VSDFGEGRTVSARKRHSCEWCHSPIVMGERHFRFSGKWQGDFQDWRMHFECQDAHQRETYEGEICDSFHERGRTCGETEDERRRFAKELGQTLRKAVEKGLKQDHEWTRLANSLIGDVKDWQDDETIRVDKAREAALEQEAKPSVDAGKES
jgi:hypothetical protein